MMANIWEKDISILAGNLNSGLTYHITTVATIFVISFFELNAGSFRFFWFFFAFFDTYVTNWKQQKSLLNLLLPKSYLSEEKRISSTSQRGKVVSKALEKILSSALFVSWMIFVWSFPWVYMRFLFSYSKIQQ